MNARYIAILVLIAAAAVAADDNCNVPGFFESYCQHGGVCQDVQTSAGYSSPSCLCPTPSIGKSCSFNVRECRDNPCINGGSCRNTPAAANCASGNNYDCFRCSCPPGWGYPMNYPWTAQNKGGICDTPRPLTGCERFPCQNGGTCTTASDPSAYSCTCTGTGFVGQNCTFNCTLGGVCQNGGTCHQGNCLCLSTYTGVDCSSPRFCTNSPCNNGATCSNAGAGSCQCAAGWSGKFCQTASFCSGSPCAAGGTCHDNFDTTTYPNGGVGACACPAGFNSGWFASATPQFADMGITNCTTSNFCGASPCQNSATCVQSTTSNDGTCSCAEGFAGKYCEVNLANIKVCYNKIQGKQCFDHGSCSCVDQSSCRSSGWSTACQCQTAASSNTGLNYADCRCNSTYVPKCPTVTGGSAPLASIGDAPCQNGGTCVEHANGWGCDCRAGYYGSRCESYHNPCSSSPCQNNGQCDLITETDGHANMLTDTYWTYRCQCKYPYFGRECQNKIEDPANVCTNTVPAPVCQNGGSCIPAPYNWNYVDFGAYANDGYSTVMGGGGFFTPQKTGGFYGRTIRYDYGTWYCQCPPGYSGTRCEYLAGYNPRHLICGVNWPAGDSHTCKNGGTCIDDPNKISPRCACPCGFSGEYCEIIANGLDATSAANFMDNYGVKTEFCGSNICQNGGSCTTSADWRGASCNCAAGFYGYYCQFQGLAAGANVLPSAIIVAAAAIVAAALRM